MAALKLSLLGPFTAELDDQPLINFRTTKVQALLIYLAVENDRAHRREHLFTLLWPGMPEKSARHNLRQVLYTLRQIIPKIPAVGAGEAVPLLFADRQTIQFNPEVDIEVDIHQMESLFNLSKNHEHSSLFNCESCIHALEQVISLYRGDFLTDFYLEDSNTFEDWSEAVRGKCRNLLLDALSTLAEICIYNQDYAKAQVYIEQQLEIDNLREDSHRQCIETLALEGRRVEALRHYQEYVQMLESELNLPPSPRMTDLYESIRSGDLGVRSSKLEAAPVELKPPRNNLVPQLTPFIGRENELTRLDELLRDPDTRLITIAGPGGMGKTRLAIACAERQLEQKNGEQFPYLFPDGVFFVPLTDIENPDQIPGEIAKALNLTFNPPGLKVRDSGAVDQPLMYYYLRRKQVLLVLDNFETLLDGGRELKTILQVAPGIQILVTSRERLNLHCEQVFPIGGLEFPGWEVFDDPCDYTAMQLFLGRAQRVLPDFKIKGSDLVHLTRICRLVGGMPLGLELAASWVDMLSVKQIADEIKKGIDFLETHIRDIPERHRNLRVVCDSTWNHLSQKEQDIFTRLSVFRGGFTWEAAKEVTGTSLRTLVALQNKSLLGFDPTKKRYRIHPHLRDYGIEQLKTQPGNEADAYDHHSAYYADFTNECAKKYFRGQSNIAIANMDLEIANIIEALHKSLNYGSLLQIEQILNILCYYFEWHQRIQETMAIYHEAAQIFQKMASDVRSKVHPTHSIIEIGRVHTKVLNFLGYYSLEHLANKKQASRYLEESVKILNQIELLNFDLRAEKAQLLRYQGYISDDYEFATPLFTESIALSKEIKDDHGEQECILLASWKAMGEGSLLEAKTWLKQGIELTRRLGNQWAENVFLVNLGMVYRGMGFYQEAKDIFDEAISKSSACGDNYSLMLALNDSANLYLFLGDLEVAGNSFKNSIRIAEELGFVSRSGPLTSLMTVLYLSGRYDQAEKAILTGIEIRKSLENLPDIYPQISYIELLVITGCYQQASNKANYFNQWLQIHFPTGFWFGFFARTQSWIALTKGNYEEAIRHSIKSIEQFRRSSSKLEWVAWTKASLARAEYGLGKPCQAKKILTEALSTSLDIRGYIPMVFILPVTLLILANEDPQLGAEVYHQIMRDPFLGKAQLFKDIVYKYLPDEITAIPVKTVETSPEHREKLWATARKVLATWKDEQRKTL
jgi:DNA-binding SARP family transcriptional activator/predicted ATPase